MSAMQTSTPLPQGPLTSGDNVLITTICNGELYVYAGTSTDSAGNIVPVFVPFCDATSSDLLIFRVGIDTNNSVTLLRVINTPGSPVAFQALTYDQTTGEVYLSAVTSGLAPLALPFFLNQNTFTALQEPASLHASVLHLPTGINVNGENSLSLDFNTAGGTSCPNGRIALVPVTYYTGGGRQCQRVNDALNALYLYARSQGIMGTCLNTRPLSSTAFTRQTDCATNATPFQYCPTGTYCSGVCTSVCSTPGQVCVRQGLTGAFGCRTQSTPAPTPTPMPCPTPSTNVIYVPNNTQSTPQSMDITLHHNVNATVTPNNNLGTTQPPSYWWVWIIAAVFILILLAIIAYSFWSTPSTSSVYDEHVHTGSVHSGY